MPSRTTTHPPGVDQPVPAGERGPGTARVWPSGQEGFTLVELMVTLGIVAIGVVGTLSVFLATLDATATADSRAHANALATREVEVMEAIPYDDLGFESSQAGYVSSYEGEPTVQVTDPQVAPDGGVEDVDGVEYTIRRDIVWTDVSDGTSDGFKKAIATITWSDNAGSHSITATGGVYQLGTLDSTTSTTAVPLTPGTPTGLTATLSATDPDTTIDLDWMAGSPVPELWEIESSSDSGITWVDQAASHPGSDTTYTANGLADGTTYQFRVRGITSGVTGAWSNVATATTDWSDESCVVQTATADPASVKKKVNNSLQNDVVLEVAINGLYCGSLKAVITTTPGTSYTVLMDSSFGTGGVHRYTIWKNQWTTWSTGNKTISIRQVVTGEEVVKISLVVTN